MSFWLEHKQRVFISFFIFGLLNNILYVVILSAAIDLVGASTPKAVVLLSDIIPSLSVKAIAPFILNSVPYRVRIWSLVVLSTSGMAIISLTNENALLLKVLGISAASASSGIGEVSFLQLTHYYDTTSAIGGFSAGTGGAGLAGSFIFMLLTNMIGMQVWIALLSFAITPIGFIITSHLLLPKSDSYERNITIYEEDEGSEMAQNMLDQESDHTIPPQALETHSRMINHIQYTISEIKPLVKPFMLPLCTVYVAEYVINQGVSPTLLFSLDELPSWIFSSYRDIYVVYGFLYQLGVFISRSSINFGVRVKHLYFLSVLQALNVFITLMQSIYDFPFSNIWLLLLLIFYEGLLGGLLYVNTFMSVSEQTPLNKREFSMGCVGISDSFGIMLAGCINWWLESRLCNLQVSRGRDWCLTG